MHYAQGRDWCSSSPPSQSVKSLKIFVRCSMAWRGGEGVGGRHPLIESNVRIQAADQPPTPKGRVMAPAPLRTSSGLGKCENNRNCKAARKTGLTSPCQQKGARNAGVLLVHTIAAATFMREGVPDHSHGARTASDARPLSFWSLVRVWSTNHILGRRQVGSERKQLGPTRSDLDAVGQGDGWRKGSACSRPSAGP